MTDPTDIPNVSMANTKKELLEAYEAAKKRFDSLDKDLLDAEKSRKRLENKVAEATADSEAALCCRSSGVGLRNRLTR